uniref:Uncharacterized protein n=1 Tax=Micrurus surinamensis TaxID=129470 RepID=A0A2D4NYN1_MICSU
MERFKDGSLKSLKKIQDGGGEGGMSRWSSGKQDSFSPAGGIPSPPRWTDPRQPRNVEEEEGFEHRGAGSFGESRSEFRGDCWWRRGGRREAGWMTGRERQRYEGSGESGGDVKTKVRKKAKVVVLRAALRAVKAAREEVREGRKAGVTAVRATRGEAKEKKAERNDRNAVRAARAEAKDREKVEAAG